MLQLAALLFLPFTSFAYVDGWYQYSMAPRFFDVYRGVEKAKGNEPLLASHLEENRMRFQTVFTELGFRWVSPNEGGEWWRIGWHNEASAVSRVFQLTPLEGSLNFLAASYLKATFVKRWDSGFSLELGFVGGGGLERRARGTASRWSTSVPVQKNYTVLGGLDLMLQYKITGDDHFILLNAKNDFSYFYLPNEEDRAGDRLRSVYQNWQGRIDFMTLTGWNVHFLSGLFPIPTRVTPRTWVRAANTSSMKEVGALIGVGGGWQYRWNERRSLALLGGFYGGYPGGEFRWQFNRRNHLRLMTYGIELARTYRTLGQRVYGLSVDWGF
jgi:hypothetical protein